MQVKKGKGTADNSLRVEVLDDGLIKFKIKKPNGDAIVAHLTPEQGSALVHDLLKAAVVAWLRDPKNDMRGGGKLPLQSMEDVYAPLGFPLTLAVIGPAPGAKNPYGLGFVAAFGDLQVTFGMQRNQIRRYAEQLIHLDETLPPSDHFELGLNDPDDEAVH